MTIVSSAPATSTNRVTFDPSAFGREMGLWTTQEAYLRTRHRNLVTSAVQESNGLAAIEARAIREANPHLHLPPRADTRPDTAMARAFREATS
jgi:hypothetical protein